MVIPIYIPSNSVFMAMSWSGPSGCNEHLGGPFCLGSVRPTEPEVNETKFRDFPPSGRVAIGRAVETELGERGPRRQVRHPGERGHDHGKIDGATARAAPPLAAARLRLGRFKAR